MREDLSHLINYKFSVRFVEEATGSCYIVCTYTEYSVYELELFGMMLKSHLQ